MVRNWTRTYFCKNKNKSMAFEVENQVLFLVTWERLPRFSFQHRNVFKEFRSFYDVSSKRL